METFENFLLQYSGCPLQGVVFCVGCTRAVVDVDTVAFLDAVGAMPVMPITAFVVDDRCVVVLPFCETDIDAKDEDSGVISVTILLGTGARDRDDRIEDNCADTHGDKAVQSKRGKVGETIKTIAMVVMASSLDR